MELRWYETYDQDGVESGEVLQFRDKPDDEWQNVPYVRARVVNHDKKKW